MNGKYFVIIKEDNEDGYGTSVLFPELKVGVKFKVLRTNTEGYNGPGITCIALEDGTVIDIDSVESSFWCLWAPGSMDEIKEIHPENFGPKAKTGYVDGQPLALHLSRQAEYAKNNSDYYVANILTQSSEYIEWLEAQLRFSDRPF